uniref:PTTG1 interacting protein n=1 Tax=Gadus morhua TaxID=8049 RepID=A0A8C5CKD1_GADMO
TACELMNASNCEGCLANVSCLWCLTSEKCITYPVSTILPPHAVCPLNDARWGLCWMNFQILIITLSVVGAVIILAFIVCLLCCCKCQNSREGSSFKKNLHHYLKELAIPSICQSFIVMRYIYVYYQMPD